MQKIVRTRNGLALTDFFANQTKFRVVRTGLHLIFITCMACLVNDSVYHSAGGPKGWGIYCKGANINSLKGIISFYFQHKYQKVIQQILLQLMQELKLDLNNRFCFRKCNNLYMLMVSVYS